MTTPDFQGVTVRDQGMTDDRITALELVYSFTYLLYPAGILVPQYVRQLYIHLLTPDALNHMKVGTAYTRSPNTYQDVRVVYELRLRHLLQLDVFRAGKGSVVIVQ
jgi:hypothetical protein